MAIFRRKQYFVERGLQLRFAWYVFGYLMTCCLLTAGVVFYATFSSLSDRLVGIYPANRLEGIFHQSYWALGVSLALSAPAIFYGALVFSHRIAGPLPKIYRVLDQLAAGQYDVKLTLRKQDELKDLAEKINLLAQKLKERQKTS